MDVTMDTSSFAVQEYTFDFSIEETGDGFLLDHKIDGFAVFPTAGYFVLAWKTLAHLKNTSLETLPVQIKNFDQKKPVLFNKTEPLTLVVYLTATTGEFKVTHWDVLVASGVIKTAKSPLLDQEIFPSSFQETGERTTVVSSEICYEFDRQDVYEELRSQGFDFGPGFQAITQADTTDLYTKLTWKGNWMTFLQGILQSYLLHLGRLHVIKNVRSVKIDPSKMASPEEIGTQNLEIACRYDPVIDLQYTEAVEMRGIVTFPAVLKGQPSGSEPVVEVQHFVPFTEELPRTPSEFLRQYAKDCLDFMVQELSKLNPEARSPIPNQKLLHQITSSQSNPAKNVTLTQYVKKKECSFASLLIKMFSVPGDENFARKASQILSETECRFTTDCLVNFVCSTDILKPFLDTVLDNVSSTEVTTIELGSNEGKMYRYILPLLKTKGDGDVRQVVYYGANPAGTITEDASKLGVKDLKLDVSGDSLTSPLRSHFIVINNVLHHFSDLDVVLQNATTFLHPGGFLFIHEITQNSPLCELQNLFDDRAGQPAKSYQLLSPNSWLDAFSRHGLEVVFQKSDHIMSTLFLLRKTRVAVKTPKVLILEKIQEDSLASIKTQMQQLAQVPDTFDRVWIVAMSESIPYFLNISKVLLNDDIGERLRFVVCSGIASAKELHELVKSTAFADIMKKDLYVTVYMDGVWGSISYIPTDLAKCTETKPCQHAMVSELIPGDLGSLRWVESSLKHHGVDGVKKDKMELVTVNYSSLNFKDIMIATGRIPSDEIEGETDKCELRLGYEVAGRDSKGRRIMGCAPSKALASTVLLRPNAMWEIPEHWSMEEAATVPVVYSTTYYALMVCANIQPGESILIHSGCGGVGQAAIRIALSRNCEVFTTVGSQEKRDYLKNMFPQLEDRNFSNSRALSFELDILRATNGRGVDVVLNALAGEKLHAGLRVVAKHGRFVEIGKFDVANNSPIGMYYFMDSTTLTAFYMDHIWTDEYSAKWRHVYQLVQDGITTGVVQPLKANVFSRDEVQKAFRYMCLGKHIGKIVIKIRDEEPGQVTIPAPFTLPAIPRVICHARKTYVIVGGLMGFGFELAGWLVGRGAKHLVFCGKHTNRGYHARRQRQWSQMGVEVQIHNDDLSQVSGVRSLMKESASLGPVAAVFDLTMFDVIHSWSGKPEDCLKTKVVDAITVTQNLDSVTRELPRDQLDTFAVFSSLTLPDCGYRTECLTRSSSAVELICENRKQDNLPAVVIQWGPLADIETSGCQKDKIYQTQTVSSCLAALDHCLTQDKFVTLRCYVPK